MRPRSQSGLVVGVWAWTVVAGLSCGAREDGTGEPTVTPAQTAAQGANIIPSGNPSSSPFFADASGRHSLANASGPIGYAFEVNQTGEIVGHGGPGNGDHLRPVIYSPGGTVHLLDLPVPYLVGPPGVRMAASMVNDVHGSTDLPTVAGVSVYLHAGTLAAWPFDGTGSDAVGFSPFTMPANSQWVAGHSGSALHMDGNVCLSTPPTTQTEPYLGAGITMMAWVKPDNSMCPGDPRVVVARVHGFSMELGCNGTSTANLSGHALLGPWAVSPPAGAIPFGEWTHVALTSDIHTIRAYVDGQLVGEHVGGSVSASWANSLSVGCRPGTASSYFRGALDDVAVFDVPMGADQIRLAMQGGITHRASSVRTMVWSRHQDGFFDVILPPGDSAYTGEGAVADLKSLWGKRRPLRLSCGNILRCARTTT